MDDTVNLAISIKLKIAVIWMSYYMVYSKLFNPFCFTFHDQENSFKEKKILFEVIQ